MYSAPDYFCFGNLVYVDKKELYMFKSRLLLLVLLVLLVLVLVLVLSFLNGLLSSLNSQPLFG